MIVVFGAKQFREIIGVRTMICRQCGNEAAQRLTRADTKFTLFLVPTLTVSTRYELECVRCAGTSRLDRASAERLAGSHNSGH